MNSIPRDNPNLRSHVGIGAGVGCGVGIVAYFAVGLGLAFTDHGIGIGLGSGMGCWAGATLVGALIPLAIATIKQCSKHVPVITEAEQNYEQL